MLLRILWIDKVGRVYLPEDIREIYHMKKETQVALYGMEDNSLQLRRYKPVCVVCGSEEQVSQLNDTPFCAGCLKKLGVTPNEKK